MRGFLSMTYPRAHLVDAENGGLYHCLSRCVRRAWLYGEDAASGRSFEHRKEWVEHCLLNLASIFTVNLFGYAVLSNHYHLIIETLPHEARQLTDVEVAQRWLRLSPSLSEKTAQKRLAALLDNPTRLAELRLRLGSLSWFMRYINEPIARRANKEDGCKGRFWEGRFNPSRYSMNRPLCVD
jgi:putative transposase